MAFLCQITNYFNLEKRSIVFKVNGTLKQLSKLDCKSANPLYSNSQFAALLKALEARNTYAYVWKGTCDLNKLFNQIAL